MSEKIVEVTGADYFEIIPTEPYSESDLNYSDDGCRANREQQDETARPSISGNIENIEQYEVVLIGHPIWWYVAPTIINTFLESYDLAGKTVVPFATSGGSGMGRTNTELEQSCKGARLKEGKRFNINVKEAELKTWADQF